MNLFLLSFSLISGGTGLRFTRRQKEGSLEQTLISSHPLQKVRLYRHVPHDLKLYRQAWEEAMQLTTPWDLKLSENIKIVYGIFTTRWNVAHQEEIRRTLFMQPGVCLAESGPQPDCALYVCFVLGEGITPPGVENSTFSTKEFVHIDGDDTMNRGKSFNWFHNASRRYDWASHVGKVDMDSFPNIGKLINSFEEHRGRGCSNQFIGDGVDFQWCHGDGCPPSDCHGERQMPPKNPDCWFLVLGYYYIFPRQFALDLSAPEGWWEKSKVGEEDVVTSKAVAHYAREYGCVSWWDTGAVYHHRSWGDDKT